MALIFCVRYLKRLPSEVNMTCSDLVDLMVMAKIDAEINKGK